MSERDHALSILTAEGISLHDLRSVLEDDRLTWVYASRMEDTGIGWIRDLLEGRVLGAPPDGRREGVPLARWAEGRAFGPALEVDWWREGDTYRLRVLLEEGEEPEGVSWRDTSGEWLTAAGERHVVLHGTRDDDAPSRWPTWSEARIPRRLAYPYDREDGEPAPERMALVSQDYTRSNVVALTRMIAIVPINET